MTKVALFVAGLAGAFLAALLAGNLLEVGPRTVAEAHAAGEMTQAAAGVSLEQDGYRLVAERQALRAGSPQPYVFRILDPDGEVLREYDVEHEKRLHLIVAGRPLGRFIHVHPRQRPDGAWTVPLALPQKGSYRAFADFTTGGVRRTLALDLQGVGAPRVLPEPRSSYDVRLEQHGDELEFRLRRGGRPVAVQPYLGARGHLVVLREGDLAYIHAHADEERLAFEVPFPSAGRYRLFLQFKVGGRVETVSLAVRR